MYMKLAADPATESWLIRLTGAAREFDWDVGNLTKNRKHGVEPRHVHALIGGDFYFAGRIVEPVHNEPRWLALGEDATGRVVVAGIHEARRPTAPDQLSRHAPEGESAL